MNKSGKSVVQYPKITESLLTLLLLHGEIGFIIAVFKLCALNFPIPETGPISTEDALILVWMTFRSVTDMFMGFKFFFALITKTNDEKYHRWISYGGFAICFDIALAVLLFRKQNYIGIEVTSLIMDGLVKLTIALIMNNLRKTSKNNGSYEKVPLLV